MEERAIKERLELKQSNFRIRNSALKRGYFGLAGVIVKNPV